MSIARNITFNISLLVSALPFAVQPARGAAEIPAPWPKARYEKMIAASPFAPATPVAKPAAAGFAANLHVSGIAQIGDQNLVMIASNDQQMKFSLLGGEQ